MFIVNSFSASTLIRHCLQSRKMDEGMRGTKTDIWVWKQGDVARVQPCLSWPLGGHDPCGDCTGLWPSFVILLSFFYAFFFFVASFVCRKAGSPWFVWFVPFAKTENQIKKKWPAPWIRPCTPHLCLYDLKPNRIKVEFHFNNYRGELGIDSNL